MKFRQKMTAGAVGVTSSIAALIVAASPASAHQVVVYRGKNLAYVNSWYYGSKPGAPHDHLIVEDNECDGHGVWADYVKSGQTRVNTVWADGGCVHQGFAFIPEENIYKFRVCEQVVGCSGWAYTSGGK